MIKEASNERDSSLKPEYSNEMPSNSRSRHSRHNHSDIASRLSGIHQKIQEEKMLTNQSRYEVYENNEKG